MSSVSMHAELTEDPAVIQWVVRGGLVSGPATINSGESPSLWVDVLPSVWAREIENGSVSQVILSDDMIRVRVDDASVWSQLAPTLQSSLADYLSSGNSIHYASDPHTDEELSVAVQELLDGPLKAYVASHGGEIKLDSVVDRVVTVRLIGACEGCAGAGATLKQGIEAQLKSDFPEIREVLAIEGGSNSSGVIKLLPFVKRD